MERWNEIWSAEISVGGALNVKQFVLRPTWRRYGTPLKGVYLCSSSTPPGAAVHGMCGYYAAQWALKSLNRRTGAVKRRPSPRSGSSLPGCSRTQTNFKIVPPLGVEMWLVVVSV